VPYVITYGCVLCMLSQNSVHIRMYTYDVRIHRFCIDTPLTRRIYVLGLSSRVIYTINSTLKVYDFRENPENPENFPRKPVGRNFREFREIFSGDSREFQKSPGTFPEIRGVFSRTRAVAQGTYR